MATATWDQAVKCPRCDQAGRDTGQVLGEGGTKIHSIMCENSACSWYQTNWAITVQSDGTIPIRADAERQPKVFPKLGRMTSKRAADEVGKIQDIPDGKVDA